MYEVWMFLSDHVRKMVYECRSYDEARAFTFYARAFGERRVMYIQLPEV